MYCFHCHWCLSCCFADLTAGTHFAPCQVLLWVQRYWQVKFGSITNQCCLRRRLEVARSPRWNALALRNLSIRGTIFHPFALCFCPGIEMILCFCHDFWVRSLRSQRSDYRGRPVKTRSQSCSGAFDFGGWRSFQMPAPQTLGSLECSAVYVRFIRSSLN